MINIIRLRTLDLEALDLSDNNHLKLIRQNQDDYYTKKYISKDLKRFVIPPLDKENFEVGATYVVKDNDEQVGLVGALYMDHNGIVELWYDVASNKRNKQYGSKILVQTTLYMIDVVRNLKDVRLIINKSNYASRHLAEENGFIKNNTEIEYDEYLYFGKSK